MTKRKFYITATNSGKKVHLCPLNEASQTSFNLEDSNYLTNLFISPKVNTMMIDVVNVNKKLVVRQRTTCRNDANN